jgi:hypothetical protein
MMDVILWGGLLIWLLIAVAWVAAAIVLIRHLRSRRRR